MKDLVKINRFILFDTSIASENGGDSIIMDSCKDIMYHLFPESYFCSIPTHDNLGKIALIKIQEAGLSIVCGTNLLSSDVLRRSIRQWKLRYSDIKYLNNVCLLGVGWKDYQSPPTGVTKMIYHSLLNNGNLHSVRDKYTEAQLRKIGIHNVIYTACPTMWRLDEKHCREIPVKKSNSVVTTLTNYRPDPEKDLFMLENLCDNYEKVYLWLQAFEDIAYMQNIKLNSKVRIIGVNLRQFNELLDNEDIDYVGTRLHAGIRALQMKKRAIIVSCDNRAAELSKDTGLPIIERADLEETLKERIHAEIPTQITLPLENINIWKKKMIHNEILKSSES